MAVSTHRSVTIIHFTTVHSRLDTRLRFKEAESLAQRYPGQVALFVMDGHGNDLSVPSSLRIFDVGVRPKGRVARFLIGNWRMFKAIRAVQPKIVHFHDPELIPVGLLLKLFRIKVIYDIHEDVPKQVLTKNYIKPEFVRRVLSKLISLVERFAVLRFDAAVVAVASIGKRFPAANTLLVRNFPRSDLMNRRYVPVDIRQHFVINYAGSLSKMRGVGDLVDAMALLPEGFELQLFGTWHPASLEDECRLLPGWSKCRFLGRVPHDEVVNYMQRAHLGVQLTHDIPNHTGGLATKVFEYLFLGVPVLMSDTTEKRAVYGNLVSYAKPSAPKAIAAAIRNIASDYDFLRGQTESNVPSVRARYSWEAEEAGLVELYDRLIKLGEKQ